MRAQHLNARVGDQQSTGLKRGTGNEREGNLVRNPTVTNAQWNNQTAERRNLSGNLTQLEQRRCYSATVG